MPVVAGSPTAPTQYNKLLDDLVNSSTGHRHLGYTTPILVGSAALPWGGAAQRAILDQDYNVFLRPQVLPAATWQERQLIKIVSWGSAGTASAFVLGERGAHAMRATSCIQLPLDATGKLSVIPVFIADNPPGLGTAILSLRVELSGQWRNIGARTYTLTFPYTPPTEVVQMATPFAFSVPDFSPGGPQVISCSLQRTWEGVFSGAVLCVGIMLRYAAAG